MYRVNCTNGHTVTSDDIHSQGINPRLDCKLDSGAVAAVNMVEVVYLGKIRNGRVGPAVYYVEIVPTRLNGKRMS